MTNCMNHFRSFALAGVAACIGAALLPSLQADTWDKTTKLTVNRTASGAVLLHARPYRNTSAWRVCHGAG